METNKKPREIDYLLLVLSLENPEHIDPPACLYDLFLELSSKPSNVLKLDHTYSVPEDRCPMCGDVCRLPNGVFQCGYCPKMYHKDCLNSSLTTLPNGGRWICPNHPRIWKECMVALPTVIARELSARRVDIEKVMVFKDINMGSAVMTVGHCRRVRAAPGRHAVPPRLQLSCCHVFQQGDPRIQAVQLLIVRVGRDHKQRRLQIEGAAP